MKKEMIELCALWEKQTKNGDTFYTGSLNGLDVLVFKNQYKKESKHPDFKVYLAKKEKKEDQAKDDFGPGPSFSDSEIPF